MNDPIPRGEYKLLFIMRLTCADRNLEVFRAKDMKQAPSDKEIASYDYVFDYRDGRFIELKTPAS